MMHNSLMLKILKEADMILGCSPWMRFVKFKFRTPWSHENGYKKFEIRIYRGEFVTIGGDCATEHVTIDEALEFLNNQGAEFVGMV